MSFLYMVIFPAILEVFALIFLYDISIKLDLMLTIPFIILPVLFWLIWRGICALFKPTIITYVLPFEAHGKIEYPGPIPKFYPVHISCTDDTLHYRQGLIEIYERDVHYQDVEYVTLLAQGSGDINLNLRCKNSPPVDIAFSLFPSNVAVIILDIILRKAPHVKCNKMVNQFRQGKYWPTDTSFLA